MLLLHLLTWSPLCSLAKQCVTFLLDHQAITKAEDFLCPNPPNDADIFIISWIMHEYVSGAGTYFSVCLTSPRCDEIMLDGSPKPVGAVRSRYTHAQKMRASMTHIFGRDLGQGNQCWTKDERTDRMKGNPSVSPQLASYMVSLRNRKVHIPVAALFWSDSNCPFFAGSCW